MICPKCSKEAEVKSEFLNILTLTCGHAVPKPKEIEEEEVELLKVADFLPLPELPKVIEPEVLKVGEVSQVKFESSDGRVPYEFQEQGIDFIRESGFRCLIADEMGLGKTIQALGALKKNPKDTLPVLILVKSSLKLQWFSELVRWCGVKGYLCQIITDGKTEPVQGFKVYIASYDVLRRFTKKSKKTIKTQWGNEKEVTEYSNPFYDFPFKTIILDEAQSIKNIKSTRTEEVFRICEGKPNVIALSGTPFKNNILEYYPILHLLRPDIFSSEERFEKLFVKYGWIGSSYKAVGLRDPSYFKEITENFVIRRERKEVMPQLPEINRVFHHVDFETEKMKRDYYSAEDELIRNYEKAARSKSPQELLGIMAVCRHIVGLTKVRPTVEKITEFLLETDRKLVVFAHHQDVMELVHLLTTNWCLDGGYELPLKFHSGLGAEERQDMIVKFRDSNCRVMIASTLAAGEGLNLQFCSDCILVERQWNPANEEQAEGRFIRIGQERNQVNAIYMIVSGTIDEWFTEIVEEKRRAFKSTMSGKEVMEMGSLLEELMKVIIHQGRNRTTRGF
jgi:SWI/SNF-related matrix-associated actin-dependent regulator 1 of chromatin subfamily A